MRRILLILTLIATTAATAENRISYSFDRESLPQALRTIETLAGDDISINFSYEKLEDYVVTATVENATPLEAIRHAVGFYPVKVMQIDRIITVQPMLDTCDKIIGRVVDEHGLGVDYATIALYAPDFVTSGVSTANGDFVIPIEQPGNLTLKIHRIGYKPFEAEVATGNIGDIRLAIDPYQVRTVTAVANRDIITNDGSRTIIRVAGTPYSEIGTLAEMLPNLPGIVDLGNGFGIGSIGHTRFCINGREISDVAQLQMIKSADVRYVNIQHDPGAEYSADTETVVNVTTTRSANDFIYLNVAERLDIRNKLSETTTIDFKLQKGIFTTALNYRGEDFESKYSDHYQRRIFNPGHKSELIRPRDINTWMNAGRLNWSGEFQFNPYNKLGLYYYGYFMRDEIEDKGDAMLFADDGIHFLDAYKFGSSDNWLHSGSLIYDYTGPVANLHIAEDLAYSTRDGGLTHSRYINNDHGIYNSNNTSYKVSTTNLRLNLNLPAGWRASLGGKISYVKSNVDKRFFNFKNAELNEEEGYYYAVYFVSEYNFMDITEKSYQAYLTLDKRFGRFTFTPGLRFEHTDRSIIDRATDSNQVSVNEYRRKYSDFYPAIALAYDNGDLNARLSYSRRSLQPTFHQLNSGVVYEDSLTYSAANPNLLTAFTNEVRGVVNYRNASLAIGYNNIKNPIVTVLVPTSPGSDIVYRTAVNLPRYNELNATLSYHSTYRNFSYYAAAGIIAPFADIIWNGSTLPVKRVSFNAEINLAWRATRHFSFYTNYRLRTASEWLVESRPTTHDWNIGMNARFFRDRLQINLEATDLVRRRNPHSIDTQYGNVISSHNTYGDFRGITLRLSYTIFNKPIRVKVRPGNTDILTRIEN